MQAPRFIVDQLVSIPWPWFHRLVLGPVFRLVVLILVQSSHHMDFSSDTVNGGPLSITNCRYCA